MPAKQRQAMRVRQRFGNRFGSIKSSDKSCGLCSSLPLVLMLALALPASASTPTSVSTLSNNEALQASAAASKAAAPAKLPCFGDLLGSNSCLQLIQQYPRQADAFTQGLVMDEQQRLYQSSGQYGQSFVRSADFPDESNSLTHTLPSRYFAEGLSLHKNKLYLLSWRENRAWRLNMQTLAIEQTYFYRGQGWGLTSDGEFLIKSNGSDRLQFHRPYDFSLSHEITVRWPDAKTSDPRQPAPALHPSLRSLQPLQYLNELEYIEQKLWANIWHSEVVIVIDAQTGLITQAFDLAALRQMLKANQGQASPAKANKASKVSKANEANEANKVNKADVLNGIAYWPQQQLILVTGKYWPSVFALKLLTVDSP